MRVDEIEGKEGKIEGLSMAFLPCLLPWLTQSGNSLECVQELTAKKKRRGLEKDCRRLYSWSTGDVGKKEGKATAGSLLQSLRGEGVLELEKGRQS